jgi:sialic acid synthase SpsE
MLYRLELSKSQHHELVALCSTVGIDFLSTPYDIQSAMFLNDLDVKVFKTASADIVDLPLQRYIASTGKPVLVATGMADLGEVEQVVNILRRLPTHIFCCCTVFPIIPVLMHRSI